VNFYRASASFLLIGISFLGAIIPLLIHEFSGIIFPTLLCFCGTYLIVISLNSQHDSSHLMTSFGFILISLLHVIAKLIPTKPVDVVLHQDEEGDEEVEMMLPQTTQLVSRLGDESSEKKNQSDEESIFAAKVHSSAVALLLSVTLLLALFIMCCDDGISFGSKQHVGYGNLISMILNMTFSVISLASLLVDTHLVTRYFTFVTALSVSGPLGVALGSLPTLYSLPQTSLALSTFSLVIIPFSRGVLIYMGSFLLIPHTSPSRSSVLVTALAIVLGSAAGLLVLIIR
jgi:hypothetical protein